MNGPARWLMADMGLACDDRLGVVGSLRAVDFVRLAGGAGDDLIHGGPEDDLIESPGPGADRVYGGAGDDGLIGNLPGPTYLYGGSGGRSSLAAGGELQRAAPWSVARAGTTPLSPRPRRTPERSTSPSRPAGPGSTRSKACRKVRLPRSDEDIEGVARRRRPDRRLGGEHDARPAGGRQLLRPRGAKT